MDGSEGWSAHCQPVKTSLIESLQFLEESKGILTYTFIFKSIFERDQNGMKSLMFFLEVIKESR